MEVRGRGGSRQLLSACSFNQPLWRYGRGALDGGIVAEEGQVSAVVCALCLIFTIIVCPNCVVSYSVVSP